MHLTGTSAQWAKRGADPGARALFVWRWEVDSAATVKLITTAMAGLAKDESIGRAEAMRRAMRPANWAPAWHPSVWAPFVVVGEGGAGW